MIDTGSNKLGFIPVLFVVQLLENQQVLLRKQQRVLDVDNELRCIRWILTRNLFNNLGMISNEEY